MSTFSDLLKQAQEIHDRKRKDYASEANPYENYHFAGRLSKLFDNPDDAGFIGRIGEKFFRLANLENGKKEPLNESVEDTEIDILTITALWIASRRDRRLSPYKFKDIPFISSEKFEGGYICPKCRIGIPYNTIHLCQK